MGGLLLGIGGRRLREGREGEGQGGTLIIDQAEVGICGTGGGAGPEAGTHAHVVRNNSHSLLMGHEMCPLKYSRNNRSYSMLANIEAFPSKQKEVLLHRFEQNEANLQKCFHVSHCHMTVIGTQLLSRNV